ncbi:hypothetical protein D6D23_02953 [Aureobasidium pullulans]|nr:hypothetical protein D6D23_02953 [Aureobasidium pullulans]
MPGTSSRSGVANTMQLENHEQRLVTLEGAEKNQDLGHQVINLQSASPLQAARDAQEPEFNMDHVALESPFATLRSMGARVNDQTNADSSSKTRYQSSLCDPIACGILTAKEAERAVDLYFSRHHPNAPFVSEAFRKDPLSIRSTSPSVFLAICSISARSWPEEYERQPEQPCKAHLKVVDLVSLFDKRISQLLLRPIPSDINLDSVQALLLYAQWMPFDEKHREDRFRPTPNPTSRYNDVSAWAVLGLAARYAKLLRINQQVATTGRNNYYEEDLARFRTYYNLISCDFNLMLSSGLPVSIDPTSTRQGMLELAESDRAQLPGDLRIVALIELVSVTYKTLVKCGDFSGRTLDPKSLRSLNADLDQWERPWTVKLAHTFSQHNQLPFTSVRWYRLALNSASLAPLFSPEKQARPQHSHLLSIQCLEKSLTAACQIVFSYSFDAGDFVWDLESQLPSSFPGGLFKLDVEALQRMQYAVDSSWISYTFAVTFLVLCFVRQIVDENLQLLCLQPAGPQTYLQPPNLRSGSILDRLLRLALEVCSGIECFSSFCPGHDYRKIITRAASLLGVKDQIGKDYTTEAGADMQSILDLIHESGFEWPEDLCGMESNLDINWTS